jgi:small-conductance mechanosensitive channel
VLWVRALLDPVLLGLAVYLLAPTWGVPQEDLARWGASLLAGFTIGGVNVSLTDIALAALVLVVALTATRALRRTLAERLLPRTRLDLSVQHSISVGAGYLGVVLAVLLAVAVVGIDLSSIALVAGALSVGIGFGLQAIVNNFVSGLILLIERPVKVGDWVVVGDHQGYVRRIHVRSTELETFERSTVILPNSELLSSAVVNWTHKDKVGRVDVRIGVDYGIDVEKVREVLLACARAHPEVLSWPRPQVFFLDFGDSALIFELRAFLRDVEKRLRVGSELRFAIDKAFREAGIEFPYPQHDIHLHDIDRLEAAIASIGRAMQDRAVPAPRTPPAGRRGTRTGQGEPRA